MGLSQPDPPPERGSVGSASGSRRPTPTALHQGQNRRQKFQSFYNTGLQSLAEIRTMTSWRWTSVWLGTKLSPVGEQLSGNSQNGVKLEAKWGSPVSSFPSFVPLPLQQLRCHEMQRTPEPSRYSPDGGGARLGALLGPLRRGLSRAAEVCLLGRGDDSLGKPEECHLSCSLPRSAPGCLGGSARGPCLGWG